MINDLPKLEQQLGEDLALVHGETDSERYFALITREIERHDGDVGAGIRAAVRWIVENLSVLSINFVLITADRAVGAALPGAPLAVRARALPRAAAVPELRQSRLTRPAATEPAFTASTAAIDRWWSSPANAWTTTTAGESPQR